MAALLPQMAESILGRLLIMAGPAHGYLGRRPSYSVFADVVGGRGGLSIEQYDCHQNKSVGVCCSHSLVPSPMYRCVTVGPSVQLKSDEDRGGR
ncbi:hypothetical protein D4764_18G0001350 [Takifugu flavidus]|uniref:Uncharacterized protein n=1 Tax=Takifugu flavidus TaxID=433684 RepID=A0A5C6NRV6_9TELE|nr:hypothetical protein D4764_18G0001350 [Takifugu flavidus]